MEKNFFTTHGTYIHDTSIVGKNVSLGENVKIGPFCVIAGNVSVDSNTRIYSHTIIGTPAQDIHTKIPLGSIEIGKNCELREFITISSPKIHDGKTKIGDHCYVMNFSHIAHDVTLEDHVTLINNSNLGGHVHIEHHCMLMANSALHQFCRVGAYSALAPFSGMRQDIPPFCLFDGAPGRFAGLNIVGLKRANCSASDRNNIKAITKLFFQDKLDFDTIKTLVAADKKLQESPHVQQFLQFVQNSDRGISRKTIRD